METEVDKLACRTCGKHLSSLARLQEHQKTHTGERPHSCNVCDKRFTQRAHLIIHKRTHTGEKPYACHICNKRFAQSSHLNGHKRVHSGEKPYSCSICQMGFCRKKILEHHIKQHILKDTNGVDEKPQTDSASLLLGVNIGEHIQDLRPITEQDGGGSLPALRSPRRRKPAFVRKMEPEELASVLVKTEAEELDEDGDVVDLSKWGGHKTTIQSVVKSPLSEIHQPVFPSLLQSYIPKMDSNPGSSSPSSEQKVVVKTADDTDNISVTSDSNHSSSDVGISTQVLRQSLMAHPSRYFGSRSNVVSAATSTGPSDQVQNFIRRNNRITLVDYSAEDLLRHLMSRDDIYRCDFCCVIFQDAAMYHLHRSMHDKMDCRCCNICGKLLKDKYDFTAHFLTEHRP